MGKGIVRKKRLPDGTYGELESVFGDETSEEKVDRLEREKEEQSQRIEYLEGALFELIMKVHE